MKFLFIAYIFFISILSSFLFQDKTLKASIQKGEEIYTDFCITCHLANGKGVEKTFPPLAQSDYLLNNRTESIRGIKFGQAGEINVNGVVYNSTMASMGLYDDEIADVMNYILNSWGNKSDKMVTPEEVASIDKK